MAIARYDVDFYDQDLINDPFPMYEQVRAAGQVVWNDIFKVWMVPGYDDCVDVLSDQGQRFISPSSKREHVFWFEDLNMIMVDGVDHTRLRSGLVPLFTRNAAAKWENRVGEVVDELLHPLAESPDGFELMEDFTMIPTVIVAELLGVPEERHQDFRRWSHAITSNHAFGHENPDALAGMRRAATEVNDYMREELERHKRERPDDLITAMLEFEGKSKLTDGEIVSTAVLALLAGYDTTAKVMSNCVVAFQQHPDQRRELVEDPSLIPAAIEEVLRWWGLMQHNTRYVAQDTVLAGVELAKGDTVYALQGAANRDPSRWDRSEVFDIHREQKSHLGFGWGPHLCIGASLARLETKVAIERLLRLAPEYGLRDVLWSKEFINRGPERGIVVPDGSLSRTA